TRRARLERAVQLMRGSPERPLSSISAEVGFATPSDFARIFRARFGRTPSSWDRVSVLGRVDPDLGSLGTGAPSPAPAVLTRRPAVRLAFVRVADPWREGHLADGYAQLCRWLGDRGIGPDEGQLVGLSWESAKATPADRLTYDLGVTVDTDLDLEPNHGLGLGLEPDGLVGWHELAARPTVEVRCHHLAETAAAWEHLYGQWLPRSCWEPDGGPAIKWFQRRPARLDPDAWEVDCSIGLRPRWP
ncbi:MAG: AraC family transcriptional regulator, partial [Actinomycetota bacterium]